MNKIYKTRENYEISSHVDPETGITFAVSHSFVIEKLILNFYWKWIQNKKDPSKNDRVRILEVKVLSTEPEEICQFQVLCLQDKLIHFGYESSFALLQPGSITAEVIPQLKKSCFLFDLDGTLVDTQIPFHAEAEAHVIKKHHGIVVSPEEISAKFAGIPTHEVFARLVPDCNPQFLSQKKWERMFSRYLDLPPKRLEHVTHTLRILAEHGVPIAIASASPRKWINTCIKNKSSDWPFNFLEAFHDGDCYVSAEECEKPKPFPDVFIEAKKRLFAKHKKYKDADFTTYVIGDGESDVLAGLAMGAKVLFLSENNKTFDENLDVKRFSKPKELYEFILEECI